MVADLLPAWADVAGFAREYGPIAALLVLAFAAQARQSAAAQRAQVEQNTALQRAQAEQNTALLEGLLGGLREVRQAQADAAVQQAATVAELKGVRQDWARAEATMTRQGERQLEHGEVLASHGARLADHGRRLAALENALPPAGVPSVLRRPRAVGESTH